MLPDLAADARNGVRGLPQRLAARSGPGATRTAALVLLLAASVLLLVAASPARRWVAMVGLCCSAVLAVVGARGRGQVPFLAAIGIAGVDVALFAGGRRDSDVGARISRARWADDADPRRALGLPCPPSPASRHYPGGRAFAGHGRRRRRGRPAGEATGTAAAGTQRALLERLHANAGVDARHTVLPLADYGALGAAANDRYIEEATALGERALRAPWRGPGSPPATWTC